MDRMIYIGMGGATQSLEQQAVLANNIANVSTTGFRAQFSRFQALPIAGDEPATRTLVAASTPGNDLRPGPLLATGRALDVAVQGPGWLTVQLPDGSEAYTRVGNLQLGADGQLQTPDALPLLGDAGPLVVPPGASVSVTPEGQVIARAAGDSGSGSEVGRLKLVNPPAGDLVHGDDGLFHLRAGLAPAAADAGVRLHSGAIEGSNVNPVDAMVGLIANARAFEMQMKTVQTADNDEQQANKLLSIS